MKTISEQTGWERPYPYQICQDIKILKKITEFCFDLSNKEFLSYIAGRLGYVFEGAKLSKEECIDILQNWSDRKFLTSPVLAKSITGHVFTPAERKNSLKVHNLKKAAIQDCWELFKGDI